MGTPTFPDDPVSIQDGYEPLLIELANGGFAIIHVIEDFLSGKSDWVVTFYGADGTPRQEQILADDVDPNGGGIGRWGASLSDGGLVVVYADVWDFFSPATLLAQRFDAAGNPVGDPIVIYETAPTEALFYDNYVVSTPDGGFVVLFDAWEIDGQSYMLARAFDANGDATTDAFPITGLIPGVIAALDNGNFVVTGTDIDGNIELRLYDSTGAEILFDVPREIVAAGQSALPGDIRVLDNGNFVLVWTDDAGNPPNYARTIHLQVFDQDLQAVSADFTLDTGDARGLSLPSVVALPDGDYFVAYEGVIHPIPGANSQNVLLGQRFNSDGSPDGAEIVIGGDGATNISSITMSVLADGRIGVAWSVLGVSLDNFYRIIEPREAAITLNGGDVGESWSGTSFNDTLSGNGGDDDLYGGDGDDAMSGGAGSDQLFGDAGVDTIQGGDGDDYLDGGSGNDLMEGGLGDDAFWGSSGDDTVNAGAGDDYAEGYDGDDVMNGGDGADYMDGWAGRDELHGDGGDDWLAIYAGEVVAGEILDGGAGADTLEVVISNFSSLDLSTSTITSIESLVFSDGGFTPDPLIMAVFGANQIGSGLSNTLHVTGSAATLDMLSIVATSATTLNLGLWSFTAWDPGDFVAFEGSAFIDQITGTTSNDYLDGAGGADVLHGGAGEDTLDGNVGNDTLTGDAGNDVMFGQAGADVLDGGAENDEIYGGADNDTLYGRAGNDTLNGGAGNDQMIGGGGDDTYIVDAASDVVTEVAGAGADTVQSSINFGLGAFVENLVLLDAAVTGSGNILGNSIVGNAANNTLSGFAGADSLVGAGGADTLNGGAGNDTLTGGDDNDVLDGGADSDAAIGGDGVDTLYGRTQNDTLSGDGGNDTLYGGDGDDSIDGGADDDLLDGLNHNDTLSGGDGVDTVFGRTGNDDLSGDAGVDTLYGGDGDDVIDGGTGDDQIDGGNHNDTLSGGDGADVIYGRGNTDALNGDAGNDTLYGGEGDDALTGGADSDMLDGGNGNDTLQGGGGVDTLYGRGGVDLLNGGEGNDLLIGGGGDDTFAFDVGSGQDVVVEFAAGGVEDTIDLSAYDGSGITWLLTQDGGNAVFTFTNGDVITLNNVNAANLIYDGLFGYS